MRSFVEYMMALVTLLLTLVLIGCQSNVSDQLAIELIEKLETAHNAQDVDAIVDLYAEDGVEINGAGTWRGSNKIRTLYNLAVQKFKVENTNIRVEGNKAYYDVYLIRDGEKYRLEQYEVIIEDGKIKSNTILQMRNLK